MRGLLALATLSLVAVALVNFQQRRNYVLPEDGVTWARSAAGVVALRVDADGPGDKAGIEPGDRLHRVNDAEVREETDVPRILDQIGPWRTARYQIVRDGVAVEKPVLIGAAPTNTPAYYFQWFLGFAYLAIGSVVFARHRSRPMVSHFSVFCLASFVLFSFSYTGELEGVDRFVYWADVWAILLAPAVFLHFCFIFPGSQRVSSVRRGLALLGYVPALVMLVVHHMAAANPAAETPIFELRFLLDRIEMALLGSYFVLGAVILNATGGSQEDLVVRQQRRWLSAGTLWGILPFVLFYVWPYVAGDVLGPNRSLAVFSLGLVPLTFAYAIVKHRLMDVDLIVRRSAAYTLATGAALAAFYASLFLLSGSLALQLEELGAAVWILTVLVAAVLFHPLRNRIQKALDRRWYQERYDYRRTLVEFASELSTETDRDRMLSSVTERLRKTLDLSRMAVFLRHDDGRSGAPAPYSLAAGFGLNGSSDAAVSAGQPRSDLDLSFLDREPGLTPGDGRFLYFEDPRAAAAGAGEKSPLAELDLNYYVPCRVRGRTIAFLGLGRTTRGEYLSSDDLALLEAVSGYVAIALENSGLYDSLARQLHQYQQLKDFSENIVESLSVGILAADLDDRVESWNTQLELMLGISRQQAVGRRLGDLLPAGLVAEFDRVREESGIHHIYKFHLKAEDFPVEFRPATASEDGAENGAESPRASRPTQERILNLAITPLVAKNFDRIGRLIILDDVTDRVELEEQLVQADKLSSIGLLAAGVAHEVNTPLAVISNYAQMLARQVATEPQQAKMLEKITSQTFRASEIVNSLLNFSRISNREFSSVDLANALQETVGLLEPQLRHAQIEVEADFDREAKVVRGNAGKLQQVFLNLFLNARDAMPQGGRLTIRTRVVEGGDGESVARVWVTDTGEGIPSEDLKRVFDPFFTTKGPMRGTGLGLAVSYGIIQEHFGNMMVDSTPGEGTTFCVEIPLARKAIHV